MSLPQDVATVPQVPHGKTARRLEWAMLPPALRRQVEQRLGSRVVHAESARGGFTPGLASVLTGEDGRRMFVKAASVKAQRNAADSYRDEIRKLRRLPAGVPAPRLLWSHEDDLWVVMGLQHVDAHSPARPWQRADLDLCLDALQRVAGLLTPPPMELTTFAEDFGHCLVGWDHVRRVSPEWPHLEEAAGLAARFAEVTEGETLVHTDARDDNFLVKPGVGAVLCDWNWPAVGAAWIDSVLLLVSAHGDGLDADCVLAERPLTREVPAEHVDVLLALIAGYFLERRDQPVPRTSPYLRVHANWYAEATWSWLAARRGWL